MKYYKMLPPVIRKLLPYIMAYAIAFYVLAIITNSSGEGFLWFWTLIIFYPICVIGISIVYTIKHGFKWYFVLVAPALFIPVYYIYMNSSASVYFIFYFVSTLIGQGIGATIRFVKLKGRG